LNSELSLEQAPPISVPFRFFVTAPLFGIAASILLLVYGPTVFVSRWNPETLALTHLLTLGYMGLIMCGAIMQMLPVLSGISVPHIKTLATITHTLLVTGIITFSIGLLISSSAFMPITIGLLGTGFGVFIVAILTAMLRNKMKNITISAIRLALISLLITVTLGISLLSSFIWPDNNINIILFTNLHVTWGILGWVALLLIGVAYQVVPMFQMTNEYPRWMTRYLLPLLFGGLITWTVATLAGTALPPHIIDLVMLLCIGGYASFSITTLWLQQNRKRKILDTTLLFWRFAMLSVLAAIVIWSCHVLIPGFLSPDRYAFIMGAILLAGFAVSVMNGMLYKIMPFLIWFHLQHRQVSLGLGRKYAIPNMKKIIPSQQAQRQFYLHITGVLTLIMACLDLTNWLIYPAGVILAGSFSLLSYNQLRAIQLYRDYDQRLKAASQHTFAQ
jgi:hypothetical protein